MTLRLFQTVPCKDTDTSRALLLLLIFRGDIEMAATALEREDAAGHGGDGRECGFGDRPPEITPETGASEPSFI